VPLAAAALIARVQGSISSPRPGRCASLTTRKKPRRLARSHRGALGQLESRPHRSGLGRIDRPAPVRPVAQSPRLGEGHLIEDPPRGRRLLGRTHRGSASTQSGPGADPSIWTPNPVTLTRRTTQPDHHRPASPLQPVPGQGPGRPTRTRLPGPPPSRENPESSHHGRTTTGPLPTGPRPVGPRFPGDHALATGRPGPPTRTIGRQTMGRVQPLQVRIPARGGRHQSHELATLATRINRQAQSRRAPRKGQVLTYLLYTAATRHLQVYNSV
jgi:hypothetical protein